MSTGLTYARIGRKVPVETYRRESMDRVLRASGLHAEKESKRIAIAADYFTNPAARMGYNTPNLAEGAGYEMNRMSLDYQLLLVLYRNHWIARNIVDVPAQDMIRAWPRLSGDIPPEDLTKIDLAISRTNTKSSLLEAITWGRLFGGAGVLIVIDGHEKHLDQPLNIDDVEPDSYRGLIPFDRWSGIMPSGELGRDIRNPLTFNKPLYYEVQGAAGDNLFRVHASRIIRCSGLRVPTPELEAQQYWGISVIEPAFEALRKHDNVNWNIVSLTFRANILAMRDEMMAQMLSGASSSSNATMQFQARQQAMSHMLSNNSMLILPENGGLESTQFGGFAGLSEVSGIYQMEIAGAARIPVTRLFGRTITGLGQSNDADERMYEEHIALEQSDKLGPQLQTLYRIIGQSTLGEDMEDVNLIFPSIRVLAEAEKAQLASTIGSTITGYVNANIMTRAQAMMEIKQSADITEIGSNFTDEDIAEAEKQDKAGANQAGPGAPGSNRPLGGGKPPEGEPDDKQLEQALQAEAKDDEERPEKSDRDFNGLPLTIEYPAGSRRTLRNDAGDVVYDKQLVDHYGFIRNTVGRDGDEIDVIVGPDETAPDVFIIDMRDLGPDVSEREDEDKVALGFRTPEDAKEAFCMMYPPYFFAGIERVPLDQFKERIARVEGGRGISLKDELRTLFRKALRIQ